MTTVQENLTEVRGRMTDACARSGRDIGAVTLVVVTKGVETPRVEEALEAGARHLGESRVQEARRLAHLGGRATLHLVGHLQTNKAAVAVELFDVVESLDSARIAHALQRRAEVVGKRLPVLIEVNTTGEPTKFGVAPSDLGPVLDALRDCPNLILRGLMTIGPLGGGEEGARRSFQRLRELRSVVASAGVPGADPVELSMGMTDDFEVAIEEGATIVRIGSAIFGARRG